MRIGAKTDKGKIRELNEDSFGYIEGLFVVADGMGGHLAGEVASTTAVETILATSIKDPANDLKLMIEKANDVILAKVDQNLDYTGMGTTVAVLYVAEAQVFYAHVGDSRIYRLDNQELIRLTNDHSLVAELVKNGEISETEAKNHPQRNLLTRALGTKGGIQIEIEVVPLHPGDKYLLCSDGLTGMVEENVIEALMRQEIDPQEIADKLVALANEQGGVDNITAVVVAL